MSTPFLLRLAWRNLWRQRRRTQITAAAIAAAVLLSLAVRSMQEGAYAHNLDTATRFYSGYLQLQHPRYAARRSIDALLAADADFAARVRAIPGVLSAVPRLESFALGAAGERSKGVVVIGVDPAAEDAYSRLGERVRRGRYLAGGEEALVGSRLAAYLGIGPGDTLALYGQGYHGATAAGLFTVVGVVRYPLGALDARIVYLPLPAAQSLYGTGERASAWVLHGTDPRAIPVLAAAARAAMGPAVRVRTWDQISPDLAQRIALDRASGRFLVLVLYGVVGFGVFATVAMMTLERRREFAVMLATGMLRSRLALLVLTESLLLTAAGALAGMLAAAPLLAWFHRHPIPLTGALAGAFEELGFAPILPFSIAPELFLGQLANVAVILAVCALYPLVRVARLPIAESLR